MKNPFKRFITTQEAEAGKIRQSEAVVSQAMETLLEESTASGEANE